MSQLNAVDIELLVTQINSEVQRLESTRNRDKRKTKYGTVLAASGSATAAMMLGLSKFFEFVEIWLQSVSLILGTVTTIVIAWDTLFDHKRLWVISAQTVRQLYRLKERIEHTIKKNMMTDQIAVVFYDEYCEILASGDAKWDALRKR